MWSCWIFAKFPQNLVPAPVWVNFVFSGRIRILISQFHICIFLHKLENVMPVAEWVAIYSQTYRMQTNIQYWLAFNATYCQLTESCHFSCLSFSTFSYRFRHISPEQGIVCRNEGIGPQRQFIGTDKKENIVQQQFIYSRCKPKMTNSMLRFWKCFEERFILRGMIGNSIVYRNSKLWKIILWLLCIINGFCLWYSIIW